MSDYNSCALCGRAGSRTICGPCHDELEYRHRPDRFVCRCALPCAAGTSGALCGRCLKRPPPFTVATAAWHYQFPVDALINGYKHRGLLHRERALQALIETQPLPWPEADLLCPLPAHWRRRARRGFDQAERLACFLGARWQRPVRNLLQRTHATSHQQGSTRGQRLHNLRGAFRARAACRGQRVLIIDDVMTTGASARTAARTLLDAGAMEVRVWVLARTLDGAST